ncbi:MAG TPA: hypothetical protein EYM49_01275 [Campylobacterales bacterium]|nr:hypothetical protein [Campylobacterales bacterium]
MEELDIIKRVFLLGISKREEGESMKTTMEILVETGMFEGGMKEAKQVLEELKTSGHIAGDNLSIIGVMEADKAERDFKQ